MGQKEVVGDYRVLETIRTSAFSTVHKATFLPTGQFRLLKLIHKSAFRSSQPVVRSAEVDFLRQLDHPNIIRLLDVFEDSSGLYLSFEFLGGKTLLDFVLSQRRVDERHAAEIMHQVLSAVAYCHGKGVVHRNIRPDYIWISDLGGDWTVKIAEFGCAALIDSRRALTGVFSSVYFLAPEVVAGSYDEKCDLWSCGILMYVLLTGRYPYSGIGEKAILRDLISGRAEVDISLGESENAQQLLWRLLRKDPRERITAREAIQHPWIQQRLPGADLTAVVERIRNFSAANKLRDAVLGFISMKIISHAETAELRSIFMQFDRNGDGLISPSEIRQASNGVLSDREIREISSRLDSNHDGRISYGEFLRAAMDSRKLLSRQTLESAFRSIDRDNSGVISLAELQAVGVGSSWSEEEGRRLLTQADRNGDGVIDLREFSALLLQQD